MGIKVWLLAVKWLTFLSLKEHAQSIFHFILSVLLIAGTFVQILRLKILRLIFVLNVILVVLNATGFKITNVLNATLTTTEEVLSQENAIHSLALLRKMLSGVSDAVQSCHYAIHALKLSV